jgi:hypothetical protein
MHAGPVTEVAEAPKSTDAPLLYYLSEILPRQKAFAQKRKV